MHDSGCLTWRIIRHYWQHEACADTMGIVPLNELSEVHRIIDYRGASEFQKAATCAQMRLKQILVDLHWFSLSANLRYCFTSFTLLDNSSCAFSVQLMYCDLRFLFSFCF